MNPIKTIRTATGMTQKAFSEYFGIPKRTIEDWEGERRKCPPYLFDLMRYKLVHENKIASQPIEMEENPMKKKMYDLRVDTHGRVSPLPGGFEKSHEIVYIDKPIPHEEYITVELPLCIYRMHKSDANRDIFKKFIERARKHQESSAAEQEFAK